MFTKAKSDLRELVKLTEKIASYDATLAADGSIKPEATAVEKRRTWEARKIELMDRYELL
jgi:hypothetical protein